MPYIREFLFSGVDQRQLAPDTTGLFHRSAGTQGSATPRPGCRITGLSVLAALRMKPEARSAP